jgi:hypothetical protein
MAKQHKGKSAPNPPHRSSGKHGGNRAGNQNKLADQPKKSSQAAGKDPQRKAR